MLVVVAGRMDAWGWEDGWAWFVSSGFGRGLGWVRLGWLECCNRFVVCGLYGLNKLAKKFANAE